MDTAVGLCRTRQYRHHTAIPEEILRATVNAPWYNSETMTSHRPQRKTSLIVLLRNIQSVFVATTLNKTTVLTIQ